MQTSEHTQSSKDPLFYAWSDTIIFELRHSNRGATYKVRDSQSGFTEKHTIRFTGNRVIHASNSRETVYTKKEFYKTFPLRVWAVDAIEQPNGLSINAYFTN